MVDPQNRPKLRVLRVGQMKGTASLLIPAAMAAGGVAITTGVVATRGQTPSRTDARQDAPTAKRLRGATPCIEIKDEPAPKLVVDPSLPNFLNQGVGARARLT